MAINVWVHLSVFFQKLFFNIILDSCCKKLEARKSIDVKFLLMYMRSSSLFLFLFHVAIWHLRITRIKHQQPKRPKHPSLGFFHQMVDHVRIWSTLRDLQIVCGGWLDDQRHPTQRMVRMDLKGQKQESLKPTLTKAAGPKPFDRKKVWTLGAERAPPKKMRPSGGVNRFNSNFSGSLPQKCSPHAAPVFFCWVFLSFQLFHWED